MSVNSIEVAMEYDQLIFSKTITPRGSVTHPPYRVELPGEVMWPLTGQRIAISRNRSPERTDSLNKGVMYLDIDTFTPDLLVRSWMPGDVFCPKGLGGRKKKLQDYFSDIKLPRSQRATVPLLVSPEGILWVGGLREDERFQVSGTTTSVAMATLTF